LMLGATTTVRVWRPGPVTHDAEHRPTHDWVADDDTLDANVFEASTREQNEAGVFAVIATHKARIAPHANLSADCELEDTSTGERFEVVAVARRLPPP